MKSQTGLHQGLHHEAMPAQTVARAVRLLKIVASSQLPRLRLVDIAASAALKKSTAHRLLQRLLSEHLLERDPHHGYRLGPLLYELGLSALPDNDLRGVSHVALRKLAIETGDTVFLVVRSGYESVCVARIAGHFPIQTMTRSEGDRHPIGVGAGGLALLAELSDVEVDRILDVIKCRLSTYGMTQDSIRGAVTMTRAWCGIATDNGNAAAGVTAIGRVVQAQTTKALASVFVAAISARMTQAHKEFVVKQLDVCVCDIAAVMSKDAST